MCICVNIRILRIAFDRALRALSGEAGNLIAPEMYQTIESARESLEDWNRYTYEPCLAEQAVLGKSGCILRSFMVKYFSY